MPPAYDVSQLADHLFRHEAGRMVAVLTRILGLHNLAQAEDVVQETFVKAMHDWVFRIPDNPSAWLMQTAKNHCIDLIRKQKRHQVFAAEWGSLLSSGYTDAQTVEQLFLDHEIQDSQLRMVFACCHPALGEEEQILLTLQACSGFGIEEAANALLIPYETAKKRLQRAKAHIVAQGISFEIPSGPGLGQRLENVLRIAYLMFNEGYKSSTRDTLIRKDVCEEAIRLVILLSKHPLTRMPQTLALLALMCFQAARFDARLDAQGDIILLEDQDRSQWNLELMAVGERYLGESAFGDAVSAYHLQAMIAHAHLRATSLATTDWQRIHLLYTQLAVLEPSPMVLLNKALVYGKVASPAAAIADILAIPKLDRLLAQHYLFAASLSALHAEQGEVAEARAYLIQAIACAPTTTEKRLMQRKMEALEDGDGTPPNLAT
jgi:RNA polymerase sigma factor (sigma-70 family)